MTHECLGWESNKIGVINLVLEINGKDCVVYFMFPCIPYTEYEA